MIRLDKVSYIINKKIILENISFTLLAGEYLYILGPNGGGKTTLAKLISKILKPTAGTITVNTNNIGYLPQHILIPPNFPITVYEVIATGFGNKKIGVLENTMIDEWLMKLEITNYKHTLIHLLSGGQLQRVFLIRALISSPELLILDEPTSAIDATFGNNFLSIIEDYHKSHNATIIHITHHLDNPVANSKIIIVNKTARESDNEHI